MNNLRIASAKKAIVSADSRDTPDHVIAVWVGQSVQVQRGDDVLVQRGISTPSTLDR